MNTTTFTVNTVWTCQARITTLSCGCVEIDERTASKTPRDKADSACDDCGKYHHPKGTMNNMKYVDCLAHAEFFLKWPGIKRFYYGENSLCPQFGISPRIADILLTRESKQEGVDADYILWPDEQRQELVNIIAAATDKHASYRAWEVSLGRNLTADQYCQLARVVNEFFRARGLLENKLITGRARRHLQWIVAKRFVAFWGIRVSAPVLAVLCCFWHMPDWRSVVTLITIAAAIGVLLPVFREWFMERW